MMDDWDDEVESVPMFRPFTRDHLEEINRRIFERKMLAKKREEKKKKNIAEFGEGARARKMYEADSDDEEEDAGPPEPNPKLEQGNDLPRKYADFPQHLAGTPICDIDPYYKDKATFIVLSKGGAIFRFSASRSLFLLDPFHPIRRIAIQVLTHPAFSLVVILTILANCYVMIKPDTEYTAATEIAFTAIYTYESAIKVLARGFLLDSFTYLRDAWNWLDFTVIFMSYVTIGVDLGSFSALRTFRVFRALKSVAVIPGLKTIVGAVMYSVKNLSNVIILTLFMLAVFALLGLQVYMGVLSQICIRDLQVDPDDNSTWDVSWEEWTANSSNWYRYEGTARTPICGNSSGTGACPEGYTCLEGIGENPDYGYTSFDNFGWAYLCAFRLMTQDYWENLYQITLRATGPYNIFFFIVNILLGSFYLVNLILAIVAMSYDELQRMQEEEDRKELEELEAIREAEMAAISEAENAVAEAAALGSLLGNINEGFEGDGDEEVERGGSKKGHSALSRRAGSVRPAADDDADDEEDDVVDEDYEGPDFKRTLLSNTRNAFDILCVWDCARPWIRVSEFLSLVVFDAFTELIVTICIVVNVLFLALDHYTLEHDGMHPNFEMMLKYGNYFFTAIFAVESFFKMAAMSPRYFFADGWNVFDFVIVILSLVELLFENVDGLSMLRSFRLLRVFKLAKSWKSLNDILTILSNTFGALANLSFVLFIIIFIFAVMGMQLFGNYYFENVCNPKWACEMPRWNFTDFLHSIMIIFRVLCGEWIETMWDCMYVAGPTCVPFFMATVLIANLVMLNLFLALLLSSFSEMDGDRGEEKDDESDKMAIVAKRVKRLIAKLKKKDDDGDDGTGVDRMGDASVNNAASSEPTDVVKSVVTGAPVDADTMIGNGFDLSNGGVGVKELEKNSTGNGALPSKADMLASGSLVQADVTDDVGEESIFYNPVDDIEVNDCCPARVYAAFPFCKGDPESPFWQVWSRHRLLGSRLIENKYFEGVVLGLILLSSMVMTLEDIWFDTRPILMDTLYYLDRILTVVFFLETTLKLYAMGFVSYFTNAWCWLDFVIVAVSLINFGVSLLGIGNVPIFKTMRTLRALRPLRAMAKLEGMKVVVNALIGALPSIANVLLVCLIFWLIFAIIGVNTFMGRFHKCIQPSTGERWSHEIIPNRTVCERTEDAEWVNARVHFDNVLMAYLALLMLATWKGWIDIMNDGIDTVDLNDQPQREINIYMYLYFVLFIFFGSFFTLNLLVGVIIDKFNEQKNSRGSSLEAFMTEDQKKYIAAMKKASTKKPLKALPRPFWKPQAIVFGIITNKKFDMIIMGFIGLNMITMMCDHYQQSETWTFVLDNLNVFFIAIFTSETVLKIFALRQHYFQDPWNLFDFVVVLLSLAGLFLSDLFEKYFVSPTLLRVVRIVKIGRILRLIKAAKGIRTLLFSLVMAFPALVNIGLLLTLVMFIFSVFGMSQFKNVKIDWGFDDVHNFQTFVKTFTLLFQICTSAGWAEAWLAISDEENCEPEDPNVGNPGNCGSSMASVIFMIFYLLLAMLVIVNMYIAVILENYTQAKEDVQRGITDEDYDLFYETWQEFDPEGTQYIPYEQLSEFLDVLEPPLQIARPNKFKIIQMDVPIVQFTNPDTGEVKEDCVFCADILDILTQDFFARKNNTFDSPHVEDVKVTSFSDRPGYERVSSSVWKQRQNYCSFLVQAAYQYHHRNSRGGSASEDAAEAMDGRPLNGGLAAPS